MKYLKAFAFIPWMSPLEALIFGMMIEVVQRHGFPGLFVWFICAVIFDFGRDRYFTKPQLINPPQEKL